MQTTNEHRSSLHRCGPYRWNGRMADTNIVFKMLLTLLVAILRNWSQIKFTDKENFTTMLILDCVPWGKTAYNFVKMELVLLFLPLRTIEEWTYLLTSFSFLWGIYWFGGGGILDGDSAFFCLWELLKSELTYLLLLIFCGGFTDSGAGDFPHQKIPGINSGKLHHAWQI